jgi:hypothetical protein
LANAPAPVKAPSFFAKVLAFVQSAQGKRDVVLAFSAVVSLYEAVHKAGIV